MPRLAVLVLILISSNCAAGDLHVAVAPAGESRNPSRTKHYFATLINDSGEIARTCLIQMDWNYGLQLSFWTTDQTDNQRTGRRNESADIWPNSAQSFSFTLTAISRPSVVVGSIYPVFRCADRDSPIEIEGTNDVQLGSFDFDNLPRVPGSK